MRPAWLAMLDEWSVFARMLYGINTVYWFEWKLVFAMIGGPAGNPT